MTRLNTSCQPVSGRVTGWASDDIFVEFPRDEVYIVAHGSGEFVNGNVRMQFGPGDFLFAAAGEEHRFEKFTDDLALWVLFYGPEGGETNVKDLMLWPVCSTSR